MTTSTNTRIIYIIVLTRIYVLLPTYYGFILHYSIYGFTYWIYILVYMDICIVQYCNTILLSNVLLGTYYTVFCTLLVI